MMEEKLHQAIHMLKVRLSKIWLTMKGRIKKKKKVSTVSISF